MVCVETSRPTYHVISRACLLSFFTNVIEKKQLCISIVISRPSKDINAELLLWRFSGTKDFSYFRKVVLSPCQKKMSASCEDCNSKKTHLRTPHCVRNADTSPWPQHHEDVCDLCHKPQAGHELNFKGCKKMNDALVICKKCGHPWHNAQQCWLNPEIASQRAQYTKIKYHEYMQKNNLVESAISESRDPQTQSSTPDDIPIQIIDDKEERKKNHERWTKSSLCIAKFPKPQQQAPQGDQQIRSNFFEVTLTDPTVDIRRYHVKFGKLGVRDIKKPDLKRVVITRMLEKHPPSARYVTDYSQYIISVGKLYQDRGRWQ